MARSVILTTRIPTLQEYGDSLGLSRRQQKSLLQLVSRKHPRRAEKAVRGARGSKKIQRNAPSAKSAE